MFIHFGNCKSEISMLKFQLKESFKDLDALQKVFEDSADGYRRQISVLEEKNRILEKRLEDAISESARVLFENGMTMSQLDKENKRLKEELDAQTAALMFLKQELNVGVDLIIDKKEAERNNGRRKSSRSRSVSTEAVSS